MAQMPDKYGNLTDIEFAEELKKLPIDTKAKIYANRVNLGGLYSRKPVTLKFEYEGGFACWSDSDGNLLLEVPLDLHGRIVGKSEEGTEDTEAEKRRYQLLVRVAEAENGAYRETGDGACMTYYSLSKKDVKLWTKGAKAIMKMLRRWSSLEKVL